MSEPITVLVTAIGGGGHGEQILKALLLAPQGRYRILGADANPLCPQFHQVERHFILPRASDPEYLNAVLEICRAEGVCALFHGCEPELLLMSRERDRIQAAGIFLPINPVEVIETCMNKVRTGAALAALGFSPPHFVQVTRMTDLDTVKDFPVVVKPSIGSGGSANCFIAQNRAQLQALGNYLDLDRIHDQHFVVQEYVGTPDQEYTVGVLHDMEGNFINSIAVRRELGSQLNVRTAVPNRSGRADLGPTLVVSSGISHGYVGDYPDVTGPCEAIARGLGVRGVVNIQCRLVNGVVKVFEINPRFSGTTSIRALMGYNEPDVLLRRHVMGQEIIPRFHYRHGLVLRSLMETTVLSV